VWKIKVLPNLYGDLDSIRVRGVGDWGYRVLKFVGRIGVVLMDEVRLGSMRGVLGQSWEHEGGSGLSR